MQSPPTPPSVPPPADPVHDWFVREPDLVAFRVDSEGRILDWPVAGTRILGWRPTDVVGRHFEVVLPDEDRRLWQKSIEARKLLGTGETNIHLLAQGGETVPCALRMISLGRDATDAVLVFRERRGDEATERWLRWSRSLLSVLGNGTLVLDSGGRIRELGPGWLLGLPGKTHDWLGKHVGDLFDSDRRDVLAALRQAARTGDWSGSLSIAGAPVSTRLKAVRGHQGSLEAFVGARLPDSSLEVRDLFRKIPVGMILVDRDFKILEWNPEVRSICGTTSLPANPTGLDVRSIAMFQTTEIQQALEGLGHGEGFDLPEARLKDAPSASPAVQLRGKVLTTEARETSGYLLIALSRGGKTHVEKQLARAQQMESIGNFASGLAHDFGNFVSMILGKSSMLRVKLPDDPHITSDLDDIEAAGKRAQHLAQELMKFARGGRSRVEPLSINKLVRDIESLIRASLGKKVELVFELAEDLGAVHGDEVELQQMLMNLCLNARDAMPERGRLKIESREATPDEIARLAVGDEVAQAVCLTVRDNGIGMPPEVSERIFEPFFTTKEDSKGSGLGLAMVYGIVRRHGGIIDVRSQVGAGTTFEILLPVGESATGGAIPGRSGYRILVVDDEPAFREMVKLVLEDEGHEVIAASSGVEALKTIRTRIADLSLVVLDLRMPGIDGLSVLAEIRALAAELPVLITTGYADPLEKQEALRKGAGMVLEKPYRVNDLKSALAGLLTGRGKA